MGRIMKIKLSICGKVMKFSPIRNDNSKLDSKKISRSRTYSELSDKVQTDKEGEKLFRANMKSRRWFLETMSQLKRQPDTFISASFPSDSKACSMAKLSKKYFNNFTDYKYIVHDELDSGLTYADNTVNVQINNGDLGGEGLWYTITKSGQQMTIDFDVKKIYAERPVKPVVGDTIEIYYTAKLNTSAKVEA